MERVQSFLAGNPFNNPIGQRIEKATDPTISSENWALNMEICDYINGTEEGGKDAIKAIRKRFQSQSKNSKCMIYTLVVLETCVKNCGRRFHIHVANKDFLQDMHKICQPKNDPSLEVQEKVYQLIQNWSEAFTGEPELKEVEKLYRDLKSKGMDFPISETDMTKQAHNIEARPASQRMPVANHPPPPSSMNRAPGAVQDLKAKIKKDLDSVKHHITIFNELLTGIQPGQGTEDDKKLMEDLNATCHQMQERIVELLNQISAEEITVDLLHLNDELNNLFMRYDRYQRMAVSSSSSASQPSTGQALPPVVGDGAAKTNQTTDLLIDLGDDNTNTTNPPNLNTQFVGLSVGGSNKKPETDEFDLLAQSRQGPPPAGAMGVALTAEKPDLIDTEQDLEEMEKWMENNGGGNQAATSLEFDQFLAAKAGGTVPGIPAAVGSRPVERQIKKDEDDKMFAL
ncbi:DgyrCDS5253 [Dimorphilus gyrociliatus]|uniref:DgyrCDS5253 n=1 Tax=Dimorphilus gyrociliatus TaxID=2664684 RepID=A0A7I8VKY7_9ANNE|nr:DgyrCDS5253 [Dimorphilus gyrociliatus]